MWQLFVKSLGNMNLITCLGLESRNGTNRFQVSTPRISAGQIAGYRPSRPSVLRATTTPSNPYTLDPLPCPSYGSNYWYTRQTYPAVVMGNHAVSLLPVLGLSPRNIRIQPCSPLGSFQLSSAYYNCICNRLIRIYKQYWSAIFKFYREVTNNKDIFFSESITISNLYDITLLKY